MAAQDLLFELWMDFLNTTIRSAKVTVDDVVIEKPIFRTSVESSIIKKYIYLDQEFGNVSRAALFDGQGREVEVEEMNIEKTQDGQMIVFFYAFELTKRGVTLG